MNFELVSEFEPRGDQPRAIDSLVRGIEAGEKQQTLLGVTGSGKTFTMAHTIARLNRPALVMAPNKTLAAQLFGEFKALFPKNAVEYFVSYYDYYQPEAYIPSTDTYIEKDASRNEALERMRNSATRSLLDRRDVIIVASVSCIYGLGSVESYKELAVSVEKGERIDRDLLLRRLASIQYSRNFLDFRPGAMRARGDVIEVFPSYEEDRIVRIEMFGDEIDSICEVHHKTGELLSNLEKVTIYPTSQYAQTKDKVLVACEAIEKELEERLSQLRRADKEMEAERLDRRTRLDLEMLREMGVCHGIENYSRHLDGRSPGEAPDTLINYFPKDFLLFIDESHVSVPQIGGMFRGDRNRKQVLVDYGFRLPCALDNRPLKFEEFEALIGQRVFVSATPGPYEKEHAKEKVVEQIVRPTGLLDPELEVRPAKTQIDDLLHEIRLREKRDERVLVTTLTKRMSEELSDYFADLGVKVKYLHSDIDTLERMSILRDLRLGLFHCLIGINLLREGLDLPEVSLVAILDADKEGFLRSETSLIQTFGRAARNVNGRAILYADTITSSMKAAMEETKRRRAVQEAYNRENGITPKTIKKNIRDLLETIYEADYAAIPKVAEDSPAYGDFAKDKKAVRRRIEELRREMYAASASLEFEKATKLRDEVFRLEKLELEK